MSLEFWLLKGNEKQKLRAAAGHTAAYPNPRQRLEKNTPFSLFIPMLLVTTAAAADTAATAVAAAAQVAAGGGPAIVYNTIETA